VFAVIHWILKINNRGGIIMAFDFKNATKLEFNTECTRIAREIGDYQFFTKKELNYLPEILQDGEQILAFSSGLMDNNTWLITLTDKRIIFLDKGLIYGLKQTIIDLDKVNAVSGSTGLIFGRISITDGAKERKISNVLKKTVKPFTNKVQEAIEHKKRSSISSNMTVDVDPYEKLEKLSRLKDKGIITEGEFIKEKNKILGQ